MANEIMEKKVTYMVNDEEISLTGGMVEKFIKKGNSKLTTAEIGMFLNLCKYQKLNPLINEAYIVKFGNDANIIVGKDAYMKRAENNPQYMGLEAGLILERDKEIIEVEGAFKLKTDTLLGAWAKVHRKDRQVPIVQKVSLEEYTTGKSTWKNKPTTMIRKVAIVQAMREAFPTDLGGLYTSEEMDKEIKPSVAQVDVVQEVKEEIKENANKETMDFNEDVQVVEAEYVEVQEQSEDSEEPGF